MTRIARTTAVVAVVLLVAAACGGSDETGSDGTEATTTSTSTASSETSAATVSSTTTSTPSTSAAVPDLTVNVYFGVGDGSDCSVVDAFPRTVAAESDPVVVAFNELVTGPTADEIAAGAGSFFSPATAAVVRSVTLSEGLLIVDFVGLDVLTPNASTSCGSSALLAELNGTAFQFTEVERARYQLDGSCDAFGNWLQYECMEFDRDGARAVVSINDRASGAGCTPSMTDGLPDGRWFGYVTPLDGAQVSFDLACWFTGRAAADAATEDGDESPPPNDYHIRNTSDRLRTLTVERSAEVFWLPEPGDPASILHVTYDEWRAEQPARSYRPGVWLTVGDGQVLTLEEQYQP